MSTTQAQRNTTANILYAELKSNFEKLSISFVSQSQLDKLGSLINEYGLNVGGGDKTGFQQLYPTYEPIKTRITLFRNLPKYQTDNAFKTFVVALLTLVNIAWSLQLLSPPESDQLLQKIWLLCGEIANEVK